MNLFACKSPGPGRPKDLEKRAAILDAAKQMFPRLGFEGTSMDAIAASAGVSKLTVYSHFRDKETLFVEAIRQKCEEQLPPEFFAPSVRGPIRKTLLMIARGFFGLVVSDEAIGLARMLMADACKGNSRLPQLFWEAGPKRSNDTLEHLLASATETGQLDVQDPHRAAGQFLCLVKGEYHMRRLIGCSEPITATETERHIESVVDMFLRAYAPRAVS